MTDADIVADVARILKTHPRGPFLSKARKKTGRQPHYEIVLGGQNAIKAMRRIYPYMGARRQAAIWEALNAGAV